jgi:hypothetical protein
MTNSNALVLAFRELPKPNVGGPTSRMFVGLLSLESDLMFDNLKGKDTGRTLR